MQRGAALKICGVFGKNIREMEAEVNMEQYIVDVVMAVVLGIFTIEDIRKKSLGIWQVTAALFAATLYRCYCIYVTGIGWEQALASGVFISILAAAAFFKMIGVGDVAVMLIVNMVKGFVFSFSAFAIAITAAAVISILLLCLRRIGRKCSMPLVPYICIGYMEVILCG